MLQFLDFHLDLLLLLLLQKEATFIKLALAKGTLLGRLLVRLDLVHVGRLEGLYLLGEIPNKYF
jgi:hypothetical protein